MVLAGPATAAWQGWDSTPEPNSAFDRDNDFMFDKAEGDAEDQKIYFDAFVLESTSYVGVTRTTNPVAGMNLMPMTGYYVRAILGYWVDCNGDDYIGNALTGQTAYSATLLADDEKCPEGSPYNDGDTVDEFRAIYRGEVEADEDPDDCEPTDPREPDHDLILQCDGAAVVTTTVDPNDIYDPEARIWGDWGTPDEDAIPKQGLTPLPPGTLTSWYGHFRYLDDATLGDLSATVDGLAGDGTYYGVPAQLPDTYLGPYGDPADPDGNPDSPAAYVRYGYNTSTTEQGGEADCGQADNPCEGSYAQPQATVFDCRSRDDGEGLYLPTNIRLGDFGADPETGEVTANPDPSVEDEYWAPPLAVNVDPFGSADGTLNYNWRSIWSLGIWTGAEEDGCDGSAHLPYGNLETPGQLSDVNNDKTTADHELFPRTEQRFRTASDSGLPDNVPYPHNGYCNVEPCRAGVVVNGVIIPSSGYWEGDTRWSRRPPRALWGVSEPGFLTMYADVSTAASAEAGASLAAALPGGDNAAQYGDEACSSFDSTGTSTVGWACDPAVWNEDVASDIAPIVGDFYDLRDEDCYDGSLFGAEAFPTGGC